MLLGGGLRSPSAFLVLTLFTRSLCDLIITVILNVFILRFFCEIGGGG